MKAFKNIALVILGMAILLFVNNYFATKREAKRQSFNNANLLKELQHFKDSMSSDLVQYQLKSKQELEAYLSSTNNQLNGLEQKLDEANVKLRKVTRIVSTTVNTRDTIINKINLDSLAQKLSTLQPFKLPFSDQTDCFFIKGEFEYDGQKYAINLLERQYTDTITHVASWERKKHRWLFGIKTGLFGKKTAKVTLFNNCGESKTIVIDR